MIPYPPLLVPTDVERLVLPSGRQVDVPKATPSFAAWQKKPLDYTFGGKPLLNVCGKPAFAELAVLQLFLDSGWSGRWVETYAARKARPYYFSAWADAPLREQEAIPLPQDRSWQFLEKMRDPNGYHGGFWDVMAWIREHYIFAEAKQAGADRMRGTQVAWLERALDAGFALNSFLIVEWGYDAFLR